MSYENSIVFQIRNTILFSQNIYTFCQKLTYFSAKTYLRFEKNGGTIYEKRRYDLPKTYIRFFKKLPSSYFLRIMSCYKS